MDCPYCQHPIDHGEGINDAEGHKPKVGDFGICIECGEFVRYAIDRLIPVTAEILKRNARQEDFLAMMKIQLIIKANKDPNAQLR